MIPQNLPAYFNQSSEDTLYTQLAVSVKTLIRFKSFGSYIFVNRLNFSHDFFFFFQLKPPFNVIPTTISLSQCKSMFRLRSLATPILLLIQISKSLTQTHLACVMIALFPSLPLLFLIFGCKQYAVYIRLRAIISPLYMIIISQV